MSQIGSVFCHRRHKGNIMSKSKITKYKGVTIRQRGLSWQVDFGTSEGRRIQRSFNTKQEAKNSVDSHLEERRLENIDTRNRRVAVFDLTDRQRIDVVGALDLLPRNATLTDAVRFYADHVEPEGGPKTVSALLDDYLKDKERANRREATIKEIRSRIGRFAEEFGASPVHAITTRDIESWMDRHEYKKITRDNYRRQFVGFFNFAVKRGHVQTNPASVIDKVTIDEKLPEIFTPAETRRLLYAAQEHAPRMIPYFAIGLFAGLRPSEIEQQNWREVDLGNRRIRVRPEVAKKRRQRLVDISDNLVEWLAPYVKESGPMEFGRYDYDKVRREAAVEWSNDIMRHSYGSYHLARFEDAAKTSLQMGHTRSDVLFNHYRDIVTREDAATYWSITPRPNSNVVRLFADH